MFGLDPNLLAQLLPILTGGGQGGQAAFGAMPPIPNLQGSQTPIPGDLSPQVIPPPSAPPAPEISMGRELLAKVPGFSGYGAQMQPTGGVPYPQATGMPGAMGAAPDIGASLEPQPSPAPSVPMPQPRPTNVGGGTPGYYGGSPETNPNLKPTGTPNPQPSAADRFRQALSGVKAPPPPDVVKPSTPAAPQQGRIGPSELLALLTSLSGGAGRGLRLPTTLGQAMELKPSAWGGVYG